MSAKLYLIPSSLGCEIPETFLPDSTLQIIRNLKHFVVEDSKTARAFLKTCRIPTPQNELLIDVLDKHQPDQDVAAFLKGALDGESLGLMSEAGCPGVADPGARLVAEAHRMGIQVVPLVGPSSLLLALMASGMEGQRFTFHGYLPFDKTERIKKIQRMEDTARSKKETQIFIETPYRNQPLLSDLLNTLSAETRLCLAADLTMPTEMIRTLKVKQWKKEQVSLQKRPCVFLIG